MNRLSNIYAIKHTCRAVVAGAIGLALSTASFADSEIDALKQQLNNLQSKIEALQAAQNVAPASIPTTDSRPASANQSSGSVIFYGIADVNLSVNNSGYGSKLNVGSGGWLASRLGVKGQKDIGGGLKVVGVAEAGVLYDSGLVGTGTLTPGANQTTASSGASTSGGNQIFSRQIFAGLSSENWGSLTIGRQYTGSYAIASTTNSLGTSLFGASGTIAPNNGLPTRLNNSVNYSTPKWAGFKTQAIYTTGAENNTNSDVPAPGLPGTAPSATLKTNDHAGRGWDLAEIYQVGPLYAAVSSWNIYNTSFNPFSLGESGLARKKGWQAALIYDLKFIKLFGNYSHGAIKGNGYEAGTAAVSKSAVWSTSFSVPFGKNTLYSSFTRFNDQSSQNKDANLFGAGYTYDLYESTKLYAGWGKLVNNKNASYTLLDGGSVIDTVRGAGVHSTGMEFGVDYAF